jgi:hypothetical protein
MYRRNQTKTLYSAVARRVWERYRPSLLDMPIGVTLLRDREVSLPYKVRAFTSAMAIAAGLFGMQWLLAWSAGIRRPMTSPIMEIVLVVAVMVLAAPLAMVRIAEPHHVVRARLRRVRVIPLKRQ